MLLAAFLGLAVAGPAPAAPELLTHASPRWPAGVDPKDENHVACAVRVVVGSDGVPTAAPSIAPACPPAFAASLREAVLERRWVADGHTHELDVGHVFRQPIRRRHPHWPSGIDPWRINDVRCVFSLEIGADGVPVSVVGRQPCLPQFIHVGERALRRWRWGEAGAPFSTKIGVTFRSRSGVVEQHLSMADLQRVMDAFEVWSEDPSGSAPGRVRVGGAGSLRPTK